jgi:uncharacterized protein YacL
MAAAERASRPVEAAPATSLIDEGATGDASASDPPVPKRRTGRPLVEAVRLIMVALFATAGWEIASATGTDTGPRLVAGIVIGSGVGYVLGGMFGRTTASAASALEREFRRIPAANILAGTFGLILGLIPAALLSIPLFHLPAAAALPTVAFLYVVCGAIGCSVGSAKTDELFALIGVKPRVAGAARGESLVVDTSALVDGRIEPLVRSGFVSGTLLVTRSVVHELQTISDSSDHARRERGRRALDLLVDLRRDPAVDVALIDDDGVTPREPDDVDASLVRLARNRGAMLLTTDSNLARVARALDVRVLSIDSLADALRAPVVVGERIDVRLTRPGRDVGQAVGYLDDGTMVVVEDAVRSVGSTEGVMVTNVLQTVNGRLVFATLDDPTHAGDGLSAAQTPAPRRAHAPSTPGGAERAR